jgi:hypothetical protein
LTSTQSVFLVLPCTDRRKLKEGCVDVVRCGVNAGALCNAASAWSLAVAAYAAFAFACSHFGVGESDYVNLLYAAYDAT